MQAIQETTKQISESELPPIGQDVMAQFEGFRCLAYLDKQGTWRSSIDGGTLNGFRFVRIVTNGR